jgi:hypothetical protein
MDLPNCPRFSFLSALSPFFYRVQADGDIFAGCGSELIKVDAVRDMSEHVDRHGCIFRISRERSFDLAGLDMSGDPVL